MKRLLLGISLLALMAGSAQAALLGRDLNGSPGSFEAYYDTVLNITWLANANLAATNTFGVTGINANGSMTWAKANEWVAAMNVSNYLGINNWRLPTVTDTGTSGCSSYAYTGTDCGVNVDLSTGEMAHMFYSTLGNGAAFDTSGVAQPCSLAAAAPNFCLTNTGPFSNLQPSTYWSGTTVTPGTGVAWYFTFLSGSQNTFIKTSSFYAWAVRSGDVAAVPAPAAVWMFGGALGALGITKRRLKDA